MRVRPALLVTLFPAALLGPGFAQVTPAVAGGICHSESVSEAKGQTVVMRNNCFSPMVLHAAPGETVTFVNRDTAPHTVTGAGDWGTGFKELSTGMRFRVRLPERGLYLFDCVVHPGMVGAIYVGTGKTIQVADSRSVTMVREESTSEEAVAELLDAERASAAVEDAPSLGAGPAALLGLGALGAGYGLARVRRRRTSDRGTG